MSVNEFQNHMILNINITINQHKLLVVIALKMLIVQKVLKFYF